MSTILDVILEDNSLFLTSFGSSFFFTAIFVGLSSLEVFRLDFFRLLSVEFKDDINLQFCLELFKFSDDFSDGLVFDFILKLQFNILELFFDVCFD